MKLLQEWKHKWDIEEGGGKHSGLLISQARKGSSWYRSRTKLNSSGAFLSNWKGLWESYFSQKCLPISFPQLAPLPHRHSAFRGWYPDCVYKGNNVFLLNRIPKKMSQVTHSAVQAHSYLSVHWWGLRHLRTLSRKKWRLDWLLPSQNIGFKCYFF